MASKRRAMHVAKIERRHGDRVYTSYLVRRSVRSGTRVRHETIANVSRLPPEAIEALRRALRGDPVGGRVQIANPLPAGHVEAGLAMSRRLELAQLLDRRASKHRRLILALVVQLAVEPRSTPLSLAGLARSTLASELRLDGVGRCDLRRATGWLCDRRLRIEAELARRHLHGGPLVVYDVGGGGGGAGGLAVACDRAGRALAAQLFERSLRDAATLRAYLEHVRARFEPSRVVVVFAALPDRGLDALRGDPGLAWVGPLDDCRAASDEPVRDGRPGRRVEARLAAAERALSEIRWQVRRGALVDAAEIHAAVRRVSETSSVMHHLDVEVGSRRLAFRRGRSRTDDFLVTAGLDSPELALCLRRRRDAVERAFAGALDVRPPAAEQMGAALVVRALAHYLGWHLRAAWTELTDDDSDSSARTFDDVLAELSRRVVYEVPGSARELTEPTALQGRALELAGTAPIA